MLKEKKVKRSEWMEGLLWAENILRWYDDPSEHLFVEDTDGLEGYKISGRGAKHEKPHGIKSFVSREYGQGVMDYIGHKERLEEAK